MVSLESPADGPLTAEIPEGVRLHRVPKRPVGLDPTLPLRLGRLFLSERITAVHTHNPMPLIYSALPARMSRARLVHTKHGVNAASARSMQLRRAAARLVHEFVAVSDDTAAEALRQRDCPADRLRVIPNGIELDRFSPDADARRAVRAELEIPASAWVVGTVGRVVELKNQPLLVEAMAPLLGDGAHLVIVGDGPAMEALQARIRELGCRDHVHVLGARRDVPRILAALDCFALPSNSEGLPLVVPEAMATGLPIVATDVGGLPKVVDEGVSGHLVPARDAALLGARLRALREESDRARAMGQTARRIALERYSSERMVTEYLALYRGRS